LERVEDMARFYIDSFRERWHHGPYILIGYSFGGLVALEMAQLLLEQRRPSVFSFCWTLILTAISLA